MDNIAVVRVRPKPRLITGTIDSEDFASIAEWIVPNTDALIELWDEQIDSAKFAARLRRI